LTLESRVSKCWMEFAQSGGGRSPVSQSVSQGWSVHVLTHCMQPAGCYDTLPTLSLWPCHQQLLPETQATVYPNRLCTRAIVWP